MITSSVGQSPVPRRSQLVSDLLKPVTVSLRFSGSMAVRLSVLLIAASAGLAQDLSPIERLGKELFFDTNLSVPAGQACASCHAPETGFTGPSSEINQKTAVYPGADPSRYGNRKPPSVAYMSFSPKREYKADDETWVGGQFWDGRADDLVAQAKGPFLNPLEMNNASAADVVQKVRQADYRALFLQVFGQNTLDAQSSDTAFDQIAQAIAAYESSREVNPFNSKYDAFLAKRATLTPQEQRGLQLFADKANCTACHPHEVAKDGSPPLFTDFTYDNLGAPRNERNPFYRASTAVNPEGKAYRDLGIGSSVNDEAHNGKVKVPTLRNIAKRPYPGFVKSYLHNGSFKSLKEVVRFYNKRDQEPDQFPPADVPETVNHKELGNLGMTDQEEDDLIAFLETLSDISVPSEPSQMKLPMFSKRASSGVMEVQRVQQFRQHVIQASGQKGPVRR